MKLDPEDIHAIAIIALDKDNLFSGELLETLIGSPRMVAEGLMGKEQEYTKDELSAIEAFQKWSRIK